MLATDGAGFAFNALPPTFYRAVSFSISCARTPERRLSQAGIRDGVTLREGRRVADRSASRENDTALPRAFYAALGTA